MRSVHRSIAGLLIAMAAPLSGVPATAAAQVASPAALQPDTVPIARRAWVASKLYSSIQSYFGHWEAVPDLNLDGAYREYLDAVLRADSRFAFDLATMEFMALLKNGHSGFTDRWLFDVGGGPVGFEARRTGEGWVVYKSRLDSLEPGDLIRTIDGEPAEDFVQGRLRYVPASSERAAIRRLWIRNYLFPESFTVELEDGRRVEIDRASQVLEAQPLRGFEEELLEDGTVYIYIPSFGDPEFEEQAVDAIRRHRNAAAVIMDVRGNGGGTTPTQLIEALMDRTYRGFTESTSLTYGLFEAYAKLSRDMPADTFNDYVRGYLDAFDEMGRMQVRMPAAEVPPRDPDFTGRLIVLIDPECVSACEDFVMPLRTSGRAIVLGEATTGSTGQPYMHDFGDGMSFRVSTKRVYFPDGSQFEGVGIEPNVEIAPTAADLRAGTDPVLGRAKELARQDAEQGG